MTVVLRIGCREHGWKQGDWGGGHGTDPGSNPMAWRCRGMRELRAQQHVPTEGAGASSLQDGKGLLRS